MKLHRHLVTSVAEAWAQIFFDGKHADKVIEKFLFQNRKWGSRDRKFFAECVYEGVRWWRFYWWILDQEPADNQQSLYDFFAVLWLQRRNDLPAWEEFEDLSPDKLKKRAATVSSEAVRQSVPDWLYQLGAQELGDRWPNILKALNEPAPVDLRVNTLKANVDAVKASLLAEEVLTTEIPDVETALTLVERKNIFKTKAFHQGFFEVQDRSSQRVGPFCQVEPGHRVIDACAGAGGKSLHLAALMKNKGKIIALDIHEWKLKELKSRAARDGVDIIEARVIESQKVIKRLEGSADRLLLDVPCSGLGVLRRNPDTKWKLSMDELSRLKDLQLELLSQYTPMLKSGGKLIYATCSFLPSEDEMQIQKFIAAEETQGRSWILEESFKVLPDEGRGDGFFAARLIRKGE